MYSYTITLDAKNYSVFRLTNTLPILQDIMIVKHTDAVFDSYIDIYEEELTTDGYKYTKVTDTVVLDNIKSHIFSINYKLILEKLYSNVLIPSLMTKYTFAIYSYHQMCNTFNITESFDELALNIDSIAESVGILEPEKIYFLKHYNFYSVIKEKIKEPLEHFDAVFFNDASTLEDVITAIIGLNDTYVYDPYTFLKRYLYK